MALKVLSALDSAKTQYYHFKAIIIAGMGLFTDAYDLFCINPIMTLIGHVNYDKPDYNDEHHDEVPAVVTSTMLGMGLLGTVIGQLVFGRLGDRIGRRGVYGLALILMVASSIGCGFSICTTRKCVLVSLGFFRFLLGVGIGGDYPLSATIMSEFANRRTRGAFIAAVFSMQGFGILFSSIVTMVVCAIFKHKTREEADLAWRIILMIGAIPAAMTYYWRMKMPETARYTALVEKNVVQAAKDMKKVLDVSSLTPIAEDEGEEEEVKAAELSPPSHNYPLLSNKFLRRHGRDLFSCAATWFLLDIVFYSNTLYQSMNAYEGYEYMNAYEGHEQHMNASYEQSMKAYKAYEQHMNGYKAAYHAASFQAIFTICSIIPGYFATVFLIDRIGRVRIQIMGFFFMALCYLAIGIPFPYWFPKHKFGLTVLYGLTFFFSNFGPNTTTFIVPAELFPARFRSTCHGISGAAGKMGAIMGSVGFLSIWDARKLTMTALSVTFSGVCVVGMLITWFFTTETKERSLEENEKEDEYSEMCFLRCFTSSCVRPPTGVAAA